MHIDNARELKAALMGQVAASFADPAAVRSLGIRSQTSTPGKDALRTIAVGIALRRKQHRLAVRVQRRLLVAHPLIEKIRKQAKGEIDVVYVGSIQKRETPAALQRKRRPLVIGCSVGHFKITAGTLGCFVTDRATGTPLVLSNNHVLANENGARKGDVVIQPGQVDGGVTSRNRIGTLESFIKMKKTGTNFVDCATSSVARSIKYEYKKLGAFGNLTGVRTALITDGIEVRKVGRTTGETQGRITAFEIDNVVVKYDLGNLRFDDQIEIEGAGDAPFSDGGDSGSLIVDNDNLAVALLFAGGDQGGSNGMGLTYGNPIQRVLDALKVDLLY